MNAQGGAFGIKGNAPAEEMISPSSELIALMIVFDLGLAFAHRSLEALISVNDLRRAR